MDLSRVPDCLRAFTMPGGAPSDPEVNRQCASALGSAVAAFADFLGQCEPERAAAIIADLIKFELGRAKRPSKEEMPECLEFILAKFMDEDDEEPSDNDTDERM